MELQLILFIVCIVFAIGLFIYECIRRKPTEWFWLKWGVNRLLRMILFTGFLGLYCIFVSAIPYLIEQSLIVSASYGTSHMGNITSLLPYAIVALYLIIPVISFQWISKITVFYHSKEEAAAFIAAQKRFSDRNAAGFKKKAFNKLPIKWQEALQRIDKRVNTRDLAARREPDSSFLDLKK